MQTNSDPTLKEPNKPNNSLDLRLFDQKLFGSISRINILAKDMQVIIKNIADERASMMIAIAEFCLEKGWPEKK